MTPKTRLSWVGAVIVVSAFYALLVKKDPDVASAVAMGYVALFLTAFVLIERWKKP